MSKVFGEEIDLLEDTDEEMKTVVEVVSKYPINVVQHLNKRLNNIGLCLKVAACVEK